MMGKPKNIILLGSTGSIGSAVAGIAARYPDRFRIVGLACGCRAELIAEQIVQFNPLLVSVKDENTREALKKCLTGYKLPTILAGEEGLLEVASVQGADLLVNGLVGYIGLKPTLLALKQGINVALANKETLVVGGKMVIDAARESGAEILPVDSEHSAIFQCLQGLSKPYRDRVRRIILTASGGPFRDKSREDFYNATCEEVLKHPNWNMGPKVTVDSATLMNKGLEIIEAKVLFELDNDQIEVVIHHQSIIHSMVEFMDGSILAQLGHPSMEIPIQYAMSYPDRCPTTLKPLDLTDVKTLTFENPDLDNFPCLEIARDALKRGGLATACLNGADEGAVNLFLDGKISFGKIPELIESVLTSCPVNLDTNIENALKVNDQARMKAIESGQA
jgi:1-deoxy-D-xylulose-5-phosphate reductoisomerase